MLKKSIIVAGITVFFGGFAPVIPEEMRFMYAAQGRYTDQFGTEQYCESVSSSTPCEVKTREKIATIPIFDDADNNGLISYAVFADKKGDRVYIQIPDVLYEKMGTRWGFSHNPKRDEYLTLFESLAEPKPAEAAIAFYSASGARDNGGSVTSLTFSHGVTSTTTNPFLMVTAGNNTTNNPLVNSVTWNGTAMTEVDERTATDAGGNDVSLALYVINAPETGVFNVVVTWSAAASGAGVQLNAVAQSYSGAAQTGQPDSNGGFTAADSSVTSVTVSTTVVSSNSWLAGGATENQGDIASGSPGAGTTYRGVAQFNQFGADSNATVGTGSQSLIWGRAGTGNAEIVGLIISIAEAAAAATSDDTTFEILN